jgi:hypothetical protein
MLQTTPSPVSSPGLVDVPEDLPLQFKFGRRVGASSTAAPRFSAAVLLLPRGLGATTWACKRG